MSSSYVQNPNSMDEWMPCTNSEGRIYWYHKTSGKVTWERPNIQHTEPQGMNVGYGQYPSQQQYVPQSQGQYQQQQPQQQTQHTQQQQQQQPHAQQQMYQSSMTGAVSRNEMVNQGQASRGQQQTQAAYEYPNSARTGVQQQQQVYHEQQSYSVPYRSPKNEAWLTKLNNQLHAMNLVELERHLGTMGIRAELKNKQQMIQTCIEIHMQKHQKGEHIPMPNENQQHQARRAAPTGYNHPQSEQHSSGPSAHGNQHRPQRKETHQIASKQKAMQDVVNWGAVRQLSDNQWQTRTPTGVVGEKLFTTREEATEYLRELKRNQNNRSAAAKSNANNANNYGNENNHNNQNNNMGNNSGNYRGGGQGNYNKKQQQQQQGNNNNMNNDRRGGHTNQNNRGNNNQGYNNQGGGYNKGNNRGGNQNRGNYNNNNNQQGGPKKQHVRNERKRTQEFTKCIRAPSPPAYIAPMPADLWDDDDDDLLDPMAQHAAQRPIGREVHANGNYGVQRYVLTSSVEMSSIYQNGFEEWKPNKPWKYDNENTRLKISAEFRKFSRTAVITQTGVVYTEKIDTESVSSLEVDDLFFSKQVRYPDKNKFLIRLQHAVEHQLAVGLYRANFTRMSGETTPMYVFMSQSSGQEIRLPNGKTITNFSGIVPHIKIRNQKEVQLEMVPAEKSFLTKTVRDMMQRGKPRTFFKECRALARTTSKLLTITIVQITDALSIEATDPNTDLTIAAMSKIRGAAFSYADAVVIETSHGLFSSDEIYPAARLNKKEQAARDKQLKKHKYCDRQKAHFDIVQKFQEELLESVKRHHVGLELAEELICAPCHYLPEVMVKRSDGKQGESIGSKSRHHEWDRLLRKPPAKLQLRNMIVIADGRFREMNSLTKIFRALTGRRPWIPEPRFIQCNLNELVKIWDSRPQNTIRVSCDEQISSDAVEKYFNKFGLVSSVNMNNKGGSIQFRNAQCVASILGQVEHYINGKTLIAEPFLRLNNHQKKVYNPIFDAIRNTDGVLIMLPGKEGCSQATQMKNRMTMMINGENGLNPRALQFIMGGHIRHNSKRSLPIVQEAIEAGLVPKTGAITFKIDSQRCEFDLVIAIDVSTINGSKVASIVATNSPYEGSLSCMKSIVTKLNESADLGDMISYDKMKEILEYFRRQGIVGTNVLLYRHNACVDSEDLFNHEIQACVDFFEGSHVTLIEVTSHTSLRVLDVDYAPILNRQAKSEFIVTQKITRTCKKVIEFYIRHITKSNPIRYSILFSTNTDILTMDDEIINVATFTHNLTKNYVHHKDGSKLPGPLKYADHISKWFGSILRTMGNDRMPRFHPNALRPKIL